MNEFNNDLKNDLNVSKRIDKRDRLFLMRKLKISISLKALNNFLLISKLLSHNDNVKEIK